MALIRPVFRAAGAKSEGTTGAVSVANPAGWSLGDLDILVAEVPTASTCSITTVGGSAWTAMTGTPQTVTGGTRLYVWYRIDKPGDSAPSVTASAGQVCAARLTYRAGTFNSDDPFAIETPGSETTSDTSYSFAPGTSTTENESLVLSVSTILRDSAVASVPVCTNASLTSLASRANYCTTQGSGGGFGITEGTKATAGTVGTFACTYAVVSPKAYISFAIRPADTGLVPTTNLTGWWRADDLVSIGGLTDGTAVGVWYDASGNDRAWQQNPGSIQPTIEQDEINGHAVMRFDGDAYMISTGFTLANFITASACTIFAVVQPASITSSDGANPQNNEGLFTDGAGGFFGVFFYEPGGGNDFVYIYNWDGSADISNANQVYENFWSRITARNASGNLYIHNENEIGGSPVATGSTTDLTNTCWLGSGNVSLFTGNIAELLIYNASLSQANLDLVNSYLNEKYFPQGVLMPPPLPAGRR